MAQVSAVRLALVLLQDGVVNPEDALKDATGMPVLPLKDDLGMEGTLYLRDVRSHPPEWMPFLGDVVDGKLPDLKNQSTAAVLFLKVRRRWLAVCFGYGRSLLRPETFVRDFGVKVVLNTVDAKRLRSVDSKVLEDLVISTRRQSSRYSSFDQFGLDVTRDLLRGAAGIPTDPSFARHVAGVDFLVIHAEMPPKGLKGKCLEVLDAYESTQYRKEFGWFDNIRPINDPTLKSTLDGLLVDALRGNNPTSVSLASPDFVDWTRWTGFSYSTLPGVATPFPDLDIDDYLGSIKDSSTISIDRLKRDRVQIRMGAAPDDAESFTVYRCLAFEVDHGGRVCILTEGDWYSADVDFSKVVTEYCRRLPKPKLPLPPSMAGEPEEAYNLRAAAASPHLALMDRLLYQGKNQGKIEVCDLFSDQGHFIHVKRKTRSSTLSHLFAQGTVSAQTFLREEDFRKHAHDLASKKSKVAASRISVKAPVRRDYEVVFAIVKGGARLDLPFFSKVNLRQTAEGIKALGLQVSLAHITEV